MTPDQFRRLALSQPQAVEGSHMNHADFRVGKRIFATLGYPDADWAMVKLSPDQQRALVAAQPRVFVPANGAWGQRGSTLAKLDRLDDRTAADALRMASRNVAPVPPGSRPRARPR